ncbi:lytic transglycosylase domain-containing protein [Neotabrizicola shimadae]|uniref:Lytic transglycosylase domain-containing protein n=1 Tax=Neotabrizicola shimadae TaxID=2807096 RepID=A0A8G0ZX07_9RHOB|nr:lytic transglycosylase domain-containing protein [Neotabrizicola shimadae]
MQLRTTLCLLALAATAACSTMNSGDDLPAMRWDHRPEAEVWTSRSLVAAAKLDDELAETVPADIETWCPGYEDASIEDRRAFWVGIFSALAKHESTWNPKASGGGGAWIGLTQISPATARQYGCEANSTAELKDGAANLACALRIGAAQVDRDNLVVGNGARGLGRDWAPFRSAKKRADIAEWTRSQEYCQKKPTTLAFLSTMSVPLTVRPIPAAQ